MKKKRLLKLAEHLMQIENVDARSTVVLGYDLPPFQKMNESKVWDTIGPPTGSVYNYPVRKQHNQIEHLAMMPAPPEIAAQFGLAAPAGPQPRVIVRFPSDTTQMLLSGALAGGAALSNRAQVVDAPIGKGHVVSFAIRPFWRWQTQGTYIFGFNTILNWNDLDAGKATPSQP